MRKKTVNSHSCLLIVSTAPSKAVARKIARALLKQKLVACASSLSQIESRYWWQGKIESAQEVLLLLKTTRKLWPQVLKEMKTIHPYAVPEVLALPIALGNPDYLRWVVQSTR